MITCRFDSGAEGKLRHMTVDAVIVKEGKILLVKRSKKASVEPGKFAMPGGYMELNETASQAIIREVKEETGYQVNQTRLFHVIDDPHRAGDPHQNLSLAFIVEVGEKVGEHDHEVDQVVWMDLKKLDDLEIGFDHKQTIDLYLHNPYKIYHNYTAID